MTRNKILIVDDDAELCSELSEILGDSGYTVDTASDGVQGKKMLEADVYNLVILDLKLPRMNGFEVLKSIRQTDTSGTQVIVISGRPSNTALLEETSDYNQGKILQLADCVLSKPVAPDFLLQKIKKLVG